MLVTRGSERRGYREAFAEVVFACGRNDFGQLGEGTRLSAISSPLSTVSTSQHSRQGDKKVSHARIPVVSYSMHSAGASREGTCAFRLIAKNIIAVSGGGYHSLLLRNDGVAQAHEGFIGQMLRSSEL